MTGECGREEAGGTHVCCENEAIEHNFGDVCSELEDGKKCELDIMCKTGFCANNKGGLQIGVCITKNSVAVGEECYLSDQVCADKKECGRKSAIDHSYICCEHGTGFFYLSELAQFTLNQTKYNSAKKHCNNNKIFNRIFLSEGY